MFTDSTDSTDSSCLDHTPTLTENIELSDMAASDTSPVEYDPVIFKASRIQFKFSQLKYITFLFIGVAVLWPWNCFLSATTYYTKRFENTPVLAKLMASTVMFFSSFMSAFFNTYLSRTQENVSYTNRAYSGLLITIIVFLIMAISCVSDLFIRMKDEVFFALLITLVLISAMGTCLAQNGTMAIVNVLGGNVNANGFMVGQAVAGILPSIVLIISTLAVDEKTIEDNGHHYVDKNYGVFVYYITASLVSIVAIVMLYFMNFYRKESAYRELTEVYEEEPLSHEEHQHEPELTQSKYVPFSLLWSKLKLIVSTIFITFSITLIFPVFAATTVSVNSGSSNILFQSKIFIPFIFFVWNLGDLLGRIFCGWKGIIQSIFFVKNPKKLFTYAWLRLLFIPLFLTCNYKQGPAGQPGALIASDTWYILLQLAFGLSNGQISTCCFMIVADYCDDDDEKEAAGGFTTVFLSWGLVFGSILSYLLVMLL